MLTPANESGQEKAIKNYLLNTHTAIPGRLLDYDPETLTGTVQIDITDLYASDGDEPINLDWPPIPGCPVIFPGCTEEWSDTYPLAKNAQGMVIFSQRPTDDWYKGDGQTQVTPPIEDTQTEADAFFIPGVYPNGKTKPEANTTDRIIRHKSGDTKLVLKPGGQVEITATSKVSIIGPRLNVGSTTASTALAKATPTNDRLSALESKVNEIIAVAGAAGGLLLPGSVLPIVPGSSTASAKAFTND
jgi:hypothetical protein